ncbi:MAG: hypothetical protein ACK5X3_20440 [Pseudomonadota bacterium]
MSLINAAKWYLMGNIEAPRLRDCDDVVIEAINAMTNYELLQLIESALEDMRETAR